MVFPLALKCHSWCLVGFLKGNLCKKCSKCNWNLDGSHELWLPATMCLAAREVWSGGFLRIQISHFLRFAMSLAKLMIAVSLALVGVILQGHNCGTKRHRQHCDELWCQLGWAVWHQVRNSCDHQCCRHWCPLHSLAVACVPFTLSGSGKSVATFQHARWRNCTIHRQAERCDHGYRGAAKFYIWCLCEPDLLGVWRPSGYCNNKQAGSDVASAVVSHKGIVCRKEHFWHLFFGHGRYAKASGGSAF